MACAWLVLLVMVLSRCVPSYCRQALLDMLFSPVVVQRQVPDLFRTVCCVARGDSTGAVRFRQWHVQGSFCWYFTPRAVFLPGLSGP